jgi:hypothetical protein
LWRGVVSVVSVFSGFAKNELGGKNSGGFWAVGERVCRDFSVVLRSAPFGTGWVFSAGVAGKNALVGKKLVRAKLLAKPPATADLRQAA